MKPNIDLNNQLVKFPIKLVQEKLQLALDVFPKVENAIIPIFSVLESDIKNKNTPQQTATGVVININSEYFIFSASHIFDDIGSKRLLVGGGDNNEVIALAGDRFSAKKGVSCTHIDDPIDASVYHIQHGISERLKKIALTLGDFDFSDKRSDGAIYFPSGFRINKSKRKGNTINSRQEVFPSIEILQKDYENYKLDSNVHIVLAFEKQVVINDRWHLAPKLTGISGGPIIKIDGIGFGSPSKEIANAKQLLTAITIGQEPEKNGKQGILIGTRVVIHIELIDKFMPGLIKYED